MSNPEGYYILDTRTHWRGDRAIWWGPKRFGYVSVLDNAGVYTKEEASQVCKPNGDQVAVPVSEARAIALRVVNADDALKLAKKEGSNV